MNQPTPRFVLEEHGVPSDQWLSSDLLREVVEWSTECEQHWQIADSYDPGYYVSRGPGSKTQQDNNDNYITSRECDYVCTDDGWRIMCCDLVTEQNRGYIVAAEPAPGHWRPCLTWYGDGERYPDAYAALQDLEATGVIVSAPRLPADAVLMKQFRFRTDGESGTIQAPDFGHAVKQLNDMFTESMLEDGAFGWVEDHDGYRHNIGESC